MKISRKDGPVTRRKSVLPVGYMGLWMVLAALVLPTTAFAFSDGTPNFKLVVTDSLGHPRATQSVELLVELTTGSLTGQTQYAETHVVETDAVGMAAFALGFGKPTEAKYVFDNFDIAKGDNFVRVLVRDAGGMRLLLNAQMPNVPKVRKWLFSEEKNNTVIAVMIVVWLGIVVYLLLSNRKIGKLEKQVAALKQQRGA